LQNIARTFSPDEGLWFGVVLGDVLVDGGNQLRHADEDPTAQSLCGDVAEEAELCSKRTRHKINGLGRTLRFV
jgi:hypothetical protein